MRLRSNLPPARSWKPFRIPFLARVVRKIESLADEPRPAGCKKLKGYKDQWRVRVGDWRIVYIVDDAARLISVTRIAHRREVYD
jgi:mRNA interferase RelE/StbE